MRIEGVGNGRRGSGIEENSEIVGIRGRAKMITFIKRDGTRFAASYTHLHGIHLIEGGLRLEFTRFNVVVQGERLQAIHHALADHRVSFLCESEIRVPSPEVAAYVRKIMFVSLKG